MIDDDGSLPEVERCAVADNLWALPPIFCRLAADAIVVAA